MNLHCVPLLFPSFFLLTSLSYKTPIENHGVSFVIVLWYFGCTKCRFWRQGQDFMRSQLQPWILHPCIHLLWWHIIYVTALWWLFWPSFLFATMILLLGKYPIIWHEISYNVEAFFGAKTNSKWSLWRWHQRMFANLTLPQIASTKLHLVKHLLNQVYKRWVF